MARKPSPTPTSKSGPVWLSLDEWTTKAQSGDLPQDAAIRATFDTEIKADDDDAAAEMPRRMSFVISTNSPDRDRDCVMPDGMQLANYKKNPVVLWAHDYRSLPIAKATSVKVEKNRLLADAEFADEADNPMAGSVYRLLKKGFLRATSIGFRPLKYAINEERRGYDFEEAELLEFSIVPVPANAEALALAAGVGDPVDLTPVKAWLAGVEGAQQKAAEEIMDPAVPNFDAQIAKFEAVAARIEKALAAKYVETTDKTETPALAITEDEDDGEIRLMLAMDEDTDDLVLRFEDDTDPDLMAIDVDEMRAELKALFSQEFAGPLLKVADGAVARVLAEARGQVV